MPPILQALVTLTLRVSLRLLLLRQMSLAVCRDTAHVGDVVSVVARGVFLGVLAQDFDHLPAAVFRLIRWVRWWFWGLGDEEEERQSAGGTRFDLR